MVIALSLVCITKNAVRISRCYFKVLYKHLFYFHNNYLFLLISFKNVSFSGVNVLDVSVLHDVEAVWFAGKQLDKIALSGKLKLLLHAISKEHKKAPFS